jgi:hypothetical protein
MDHLDVDADHDVGYPPAGGGGPDHPSLILDARVATSLHQAGWASLPTSGGWHASAYGRYTELMARWSKDSPRSSP